MALNETVHAGHFIVQEMPGYYSRDEVTVAISQTLLSGTPVYDDVVAAGVTVTVTADAGNTANSGALTMDVTTPILAGAQNGAYRAVCIEPATDAGTFAVFDPQGVEIGRHVAAGAAFATQIKFAIADGSGNFVAGDAFTILVGLESGADTQVKAIPNDGTIAATGFMVWPVTTGGAATAKGVKLARNAEYRLSDIQWPSGISTANKAKAIEELRGKGLIAR